MTDVTQINEAKRASLKRLLNGLEQDQPDTLIAVTHKNGTLQITICSSADINGLVGMLERAKRAILEDQDS